ncbi:MAG: protein kinase [Planctomycetes bacterium]|nr:protein kinase [Planctomycetota bacterium]
MDDTRLGQLALAHGFVSPLDLAACEKLHRESKGLRPMAALLVERGLLTEPQLVKLRRELGDTGELAPSATVAPPSGQGAGGGLAQTAASPFPAGFDARTGAGTGTVIDEAPGAGGNGARTPPHRGTSAGAAAATILEPAPGALATPAALDAPSALGLATPPAPAPFFAALTPAALPGGTSADADMAEHMARIMVEQGIATPEGAQRWKDHFLAYASGGGNGTQILLATPRRDAMPGTLAIPADEARAAAERAVEENRRKAGVGAPGAAAGLGPAQAAGDTLPALPVAPQRDGAPMGATMVIPSKPHVPAPAALGATTIPEEMPTPSGAARAASRRQGPGGGAGGGGGAGPGFALGIAAAPTPASSASVRIHDEPQKEEFAGFKLLATLGEGGMGVVYRAFDPALQRDVALKRLRVQGVEYDPLTGRPRPAAIDPQTRARFITEAQAAAKLQHRHLIRVYQVGEAARPDGAKEPFFTMDLVEGGSLSDRIERGLERWRPAPKAEAAGPGGTILDDRAGVGPGATSVTGGAGSAGRALGAEGETRRRGSAALEWVTKLVARARARFGRRLDAAAGGRLPAPPIPPLAAARVVRDVAAGIQYAHEHKVLHRDLKPQNILMDRDETPVVTDFGLARILESDVRLTRAPVVMGTPMYMSPEQARGAEDVGAGTDIWSLGVILYECLAGRTPFVGETIQDIMVKLATDDPAPPSAYVAAGRVPLDLDTICLRALEKKPERRYATAGALAEDLGRFLAGEAISMRPLGRAERARRWARRHPALGGAAAVGVVAAMAVGGLFAKEALRHRAQELAHLRHEAGQRQANRNPEATAEAEEADGRAIALWSEAIAFDPFMEEAWWDRVKAWARLGDYQHAKADLQTMAGMPGLDEGCRLKARYELARLRIEAEGESGTALEELRALASGFSEFSEGALAAARLAILEGDPARAYQAIQRARKSGGYSAETSYLEAWIRAGAVRAEGRGHPPHLDFALLLKGQLAVSEGAAAALKDATEESSLGRKALEEAVAVCRQALAWDAEQVEARILLGVLLEATGQWKSAHQEADTVASRSRNHDTRARWLRGRVRARMHRWEGAVEDLEAVVADLPNDVEAWTEYSLLLKHHPNAKVACVNGTDPFPRADHALEVVARTPALPARARARALAAWGWAQWPGRTAFADGELREIRSEVKEEAAKVFEQALAADPDCVEALLGKWQAALGAGKWDEAVSVGEHLVKVAPSSAEAWEARSRAHAARGTESDWDVALKDMDEAVAWEVQNPGRWVRRGWTREAMGDVRDAEADFAEAIRCRPEGREERLVRMHFHIGQQKWQEAEEEANAAIKRGPEDVEMLAVKGWALLGSERMAELGAFFNVMPESILGKSQIQLLQGQYARAQGQNAKAIELIESVMREEPDLSEALIARSALHAEAQELVQAEGVVDRSLKLNSLSVGAYRLRASVRYARGLFEEAASDFAEASHRRPVQRTLVVDQARALHKAGKTDRALAVLDELLKKPDPPKEGWILRGGIRQQQGSTVEAIADFSRGIECDQNCASTRRLRGYEVFRIEAYDKAIEDFARIVGTPMEEPQDNLMLGLCHFRKKNINLREAQKYLQRYVDQEPQGERAGEARGILKWIEAALKR